jgi:hypothetical protein
MRKVLIALAVVATQCFAAPTVTFQSMPTLIQPTQCTGQVCSYAPQIISVDIEGLPADVGYSDPYFATIMLSNVTTTLAPGGTSSQTVFSMQQAGLICGIPAHCEVTNPGTWTGYVVLGAGTYSVTVNLYRGDGTVQAYIGCAGVASDNCNTAGTLVASTPVPYTFTLAGSGAVVTPPPAPVSSSQGSACETSATPGTGSITDQQNVKWSIAAAPAGAVQRNDGGDTGGFWASQIVWTCKPGQWYAGGFQDAPVPRLNAQNRDNGGWSFWSGTKWTGLASP